jgi:ABC-type uncharacterized transport system ATPase subunit
MPSLMPAIAASPVLLISEDLDELLALADRIIVISEGQLVYESSIEQADVKEIGHRMAGH